MPKSGQAWDPSLLRKSPLFSVFDELVAPLSQRTAWPSLDDYSELAERQRRLRAPDLRPLCFAPPAVRSRRFRRRDVKVEELYDGSIALAGRVPCLPESYHDLFNVLMFAAFPRSKRALHARQFQALARWVAPGAARLPSKRTREQDALTVFDEGGSVLVAESRATQSIYLDPAVLKSLPRPATSSSGPASRAVCGEYLPVLFGHALMEHIAYGRDAVRSCAVVLVAPARPPAGGRIDAETESRASPWRGVAADPYPYRVGCGAPEATFRSESELSGIALLDWVDERLAARLFDPRAFTAPGADAVLSLDENGGLSVYPSQSAGSNEQTSRTSIRA